MNTRMYHLDEKEVNYTVHQWHLNESAKMPLGLSVRKLGKRKWSQLHSLSGSVKISGSSSVIKMVCSNRRRKRF